MYFRSFLSILGLDFSKSVFLVSASATQTNHLYILVYPKTVTSTKIQNIEYFKHPRSGFSKNVF